MSRDNISQTFVSSSVGLLQPEFAVYMDFGPSGSEAAPAPVRLWTGIESMTLTDISGSGTYIGVGSLGTISAVQETTEVSAKNLDITLTGVPTTYVSVAMRNRYRGRAVAVYLLLYNADRSSRESTMIFRGRMDQMVIQDEETTSTVTVKCESRLVDLNRSRIRRYTNEYQQSVYPNDNGLEFISGMGNVVIYWGQNNPSSAAGDSIGTTEGEDGNYLR